MKIQITLDVEIRPKKLTLRERIGELTSEKGPSFEICSAVGGLQLMVSQDGTNVEAVADERILVYAMAEALEKYGTALDEKAT